LICNKHQRRIKSQNSI